MHTSIRNPFIHLLVALVLVAFPSFAVDFYVDGGVGSDTNAGTSWSEPFKTITKGYSMASAGSRVYINHGVYRESIPGGLPSGTAAAPIIIEGIGDVTIDGEGFRTYGFDVRGQNYVVLRNLKMVNNKACGILVNGTGVTITNCEVSNCGFANNDWSVVIETNSTDCLFSYNRLLNNRQGLLLNLGVRNVVNRNTIANTTGRGLHYGNDGNSGRAHKITNNVIKGSGDYGIVLIQPNLTSDVFSKNCIYQNSPVNIHVQPTNYTSYGDNLNVDPLFVSGTYFLSAGSPLIAAGTLDETTGLISNIGAFGVADVSSQTLNAWAGWVDEDGDPVTASEWVEVNASGQIVLKDGKVSAGIRSPVIGSAERSVVRSIRVASTQTPFLASGQRQVIDFDNTTAAPEVRYRTSDSAFSQLDPTPAWVTAAPGARLSGVGGKYLQAELILRTDGL